ncbi:hypothetical protein [Azospirillum argentinense]
MRVRLWTIWNPVVGSKSGGRDAIPNATAMMWHRSPDS